MQDPTFHKRWYDKDETVSKAVRMLESFPGEIQTVIAEGSLKLAERECKIRELMANLKSLGPEKVLGIHKSKNKRRYYDENPTVHNALNALFILSDENRLFLARHVLDIMNYIVEYMRVCKGYQVDPELEDISTLVNTYVETGAEEARILLKKIGERFKRNLSRAMGKDENLAQDLQGLRIREDRSVLD